MENDTKSTIYTKPPGVKGDSVWRAEFDNALKLKSTAINDAFSMCSFLLKAYHS